jgi:hypothetical protein
MSNEDDFRAKLGSRVVLWAAVAVTVLGALILIGAIVAQFHGDNDAVSRASQLLLSSLLPLFGTWVGTVLAFFYSKENFEAANKGTLDLVRIVSRRLSSTPVADKMMPRSSIISEAIAPGKSIGDLKIATIEARFGTIGANGRRISRLLIMDSSDLCLAILHRSVYTEMLIGGLREAQPINPATDTLAPLLSKPYGERAGTTYDEFIRRTIAFIGQDKTVADAKAAMEQVPDCQDVIVTATGNTKEPVVGWLSNVDISRMLQA